MTVDDIFGVDVESWIWDAPSQEWRHPEFPSCAQGLFLSCPSERTVEISGDGCTVSIEALIAIYNSLGSGEYALVGPGSEALDVTDTILQGNILFDPIHAPHYPTNLLEPSKGYWLYHP